jgi:hypothetical protein
MRHLHTERWLRQYLSNGWRPYPEIVAAAKAEGAGSLATLRRAKRELQVVSFRPPHMTWTRAWYWRLPHATENPRKKSDLI